MSFFKQQRPRGFRHNYMYVDMRRELFREMEERVRKKQCETSDRGRNSDELRGSFSGSVSHLRNRSVRKQSGIFSLLFGLMVVFILILIIVCKVLLTLV